MKTAKLLTMMRGNLRYWQRVKSLFGTSLIAYWPLSDTSGATALDVSGNGRNGAYSNSGVTLGAVAGPKNNFAPALDGTGYVNVYSAGFAGAFNGAEGTILIWIKGAAALWTDGTSRRVYRFIVDANNALTVQRTTTNNEMRLTYISGGTNNGFSFGGFSGTDWILMGVTWSKSNNRVRYYKNNAQLGVDQAGLGVWAGALAAASTNIGVATQAPTEGWVGNVADCIVLNREATLAEIGKIYTGNF